MPAFAAAADMIGLDQSPSLVGRSFGPYGILAKAGAGGMGEVYLAEDTRLGRKVALKLLPANFTRDVDRVRRFQQESRAASGLNHPNIITIHEIGQIESRHFIATEFIDGETLARDVPRLRHFSYARNDRCCDSGRIGSGRRAQSRDRASRHQAGKYNVEARRRIVKVLDLAG